MVYHTGRSHEALVLLIVFLFSLYHVLPLIIILQKLPAFMQISWKNSDLNFVFMQNFVQKIYLFRMNAQCKTGFVLIRKWCGISCKTTQLLRQENWLFRGNPNRKTTLKQYLKCIHVVTKKICIQILSSKMVWIITAQLWCLNKKDYLRPKLKFKCQFFPLCIWSGWDEMNHINKSL